MKIIVVGGGVGGYAAALFLHRLGADVHVLEARARPTTLLGGGIFVAINGLNVLASYSPTLADKLFEKGYPAPCMQVREPSGGIVGILPAGPAGRFGKYSTVACARWDVHKILLDELERVGVRVEYGCEVESIKEDEKGVTLEIKGSKTSQRADFIVGADGMHSRIRLHIDGPDAPKPRFQGLTSVGGFIPRSKLPNVVDEIFPTPHDGSPSSAGGIMTFGKIGAFGLAPVDRKTREEGGQIMWWSNFESPDHIGEWKDIKHDDVINQLKARHGDWYSPIADILNSVTESQSVGQYELSGLPKWHTDRVVLIGDAAHVMPPHSGQGASCALEDAAYLSYVLKPFLKLEGDALDLSKVRTALEAYQAERKPRVERIMYDTRDSADRKKEKSALQWWIMRWAMWAMLKFGDYEAHLDANLSYRAPADLFDGTDPLLA